MASLTLDYSIAETQKDLQIPQFFAKGQSISSTRVETHAGLVWRNKEAPWNWLTVIPAVVLCCTLDQA